MTTVNDEVLFIFGDKLSDFEFILTDDSCINQIYNHLCNHLSKRSFRFRERN